MSTLRQKAGALLYDWIPFELRLRRDWTRIRNRNERIDVAGGGVYCDWRWTSDLYIAHVFPSTGRRLMQAAFAQWPVAFADDIPAHDRPRISFIIGHRGAERIPHLLATIRSIAGQRDVSFECIVVEQSERIEARAHLPARVRYVHDAVAGAEPYNRSRAFNVGARAARGDVLVLHDNDIVVPRGYASAAAKVMDRGADFANLIRFLFYLPGTDVRFDSPPERVVQNTQGGSIVAQREAYFDIGGYDEAFLGWGGEDNDFWDRAATQRIQRHGSVPMIHLWHPPQREKTLGDAAPAVARYRELEKIPAVERIARLIERGP
jgi:hypothetical protein